MNKINYSEDKLKMILEAHEKEVVEKILQRIEDSSITNLYLTIDAIRKEYGIQG